MITRGTPTRVMGVLNVTPDSFSDGGVYDSVDRAIARGFELRAQGADLIDVGGESTRPGATPVPSEAEQARVVPVIEGLAAAGIDVSVDTIHAATAAAAVAAGARIINDVSGGLHDPDMLAVAAAASRQHGVRFIAGHWRGIPDPAHANSDYENVVRDVRAALAGLAEKALAAGVAREHLILDPGLGFDKTGADGWRILAQLDALTELGFPVLVGASRKRMLGEAIAELPAAARLADPAPGGHERDLATAVVSAFAAQAGAWGVRVHDVAGTVQALAVQHAWQGAEGSPVSTPEPSGPTDRITLTGLEVFAHHGVFDFERERGQRFLIDAEVSVNLRAAAAGDALAETVHYGELADAIVAAVGRDPVDLIETVAERVADVTLGFAGVIEARITVHKPDAPIAHPFRDVSVTVVRGGSR
ncbi:Dihydropteroate synthase [Leucobacter sp. 7(1)]|uniref:dihydropteroate synthase n=1 Tax=Leucobacter sp. 7(1) TaxID=1255613 RepID=UPI00097EC4E6|nr:dihydropteroate synthase [Leucobacter sp. 7(1)]SJN10664.1 Dihydropteroate synthase [Leucobacter sp. 7(1)]